MALSELANPVGKDSSYEREIGHTTGARGQKKVNHNVSNRQNVRMKKKKVINMD